MRVINIFKRLKQNTNRVANLYYDDPSGSTTTDSGGSSGK